MFQSLIEFRSRALRLSQNIKTKGLTSLQRLLKPHRDRIDRVLVRFTDVNGPRGGEDILCAIHVSVAGRSDVHVKHQASSAGEALVGAGRRLRAMLDRSRGRERSFAPPA